MADPDEQATSARERRARIVELVQERDFVHVSELASQFARTPMSVRRDLALLEDEGLLTRVRGGAVPRRSTRTGGLFGAAMRSHPAEKRRIAAAAAELLEPADVTFFYSGTTVAEVAANLPRGLRSTLTVVTNSLPVIEQASGWDAPHLVALGGLYLPEYHAFVGPQTAAALQQLTADVAIVGCDGLSADGGLTTPHQLVAEVGRVMVAQARRVVAVADSSKVGRRGFTPIAPTSAVDVLVTDGGADPAEVDALRAAGVNVIVAG